MYTRRQLLKQAAALGLSTFYFKNLNFDAVADEISFPEKSKDLIILSPRPPLLETPNKYFKKLITPKEALFVRWHLSGIPTYINLDEFRLKVSGNVENPLELTIQDLMTKFEPVEYVAVIQCAGNGRSYVKPSVPGAQWKYGAMGNVKWTGVRLKDILNKAGIKKGSVDVVFNGLDVPPMPSTPDVVKSIPIDELFDDIIVAYKMNDEPIPMLNGFPLRLIVPGWYASLWIKSLSDITVTDKEFDGFWVKSAYRVPDNPCRCIEPGETPEKTKPVHRMRTYSIIIDPSDTKVVKLGEKVKIMGVAFSGGYSVNQVLVSIDGGKSWSKADLGKDLGRYSWIQWFYEFTPKRKGEYIVMVLAINSIGEGQPLKGLWNPSGYEWNEIQKLTIKVV
ncbi:MAG: molybdopterin-dependent oxidoreductase [Hydrogenothermaceae bacterium]|nr:molybdopterin-dependent oxidoreductase [Hydrogenothermaceae bacterium]